MSRANKSMSGAEGMRNIQENIRKMRSTVIITDANGNTREVPYTPPRNKRKEAAPNPRKKICQYCKVPSQKTTCGACSDYLGDAVFMSFESAKAYIDARRAGVPSVRAKLMARRATGQ